MFAYTGDETKPQVSSPAPERKKKKEMRTYNGPLKK
jgi:hypothetical protein